MTAVELVPNEFGVYVASPRSESYKFCERCETRFEGYPSQLKPRRYCTRECGGVARSRVGATDKTCSSCQEIKPLSAFSKNSASGDGCYSICKVCVHSLRVSGYVDSAPPGHRTCKVCVEAKPLAEFLSATEARLRPVTCAACQLERKKVTNAARYLANAETARAENRLRYAADPSAVLARSREYRLGITEDEYQRIFDAQHGRCALCKREESALHSPGRVRALAVDHCHKTGIVRGLLCLSCNTMLGKVEAIGLEKVSDYLDV